MPFYDYVCPDAHRTEVYAKMSERRDVTPCETCGAEAHAVVSAPAGFVGVSNTHTPKDPPRHDGKRMLTWCDGICRTCANTTTLFYGNDGKTEPHVCEHCNGTEFEERPSVGVPSSVRYPHYNRGLGCVINSPAHLRQVMREQGVVDADPRDLADAVERDVAQRKERAEQQEAANRRMIEGRGAQETLQSDWYRDMVTAEIGKALHNAPSPMEVYQSQLRG